MKQSSSLIAETTAFSVPRPPNAKRIGRLAVASIIQLRAISPIATTGAPALIWLATGLTPGKTRRATSPPRTFSGSVDHDDLAILDRSYTNDVDILDRGAVTGVGLYVIDPDRTCGGDKIRFSVLADLIFGGFARY